MGREYNFEQLPTSFALDMREYVLRGVPPGEGSFLEAVLCNDLKESFGRADNVNLEAMFDIASWCCRRLPASAWGSEEKVMRWCALVQDHNQGPREGEHCLDSPGLDAKEDNDYEKD